MVKTAEKPKHFKIVEACKAGDERAHYQLYNLYKGAMFSTCMRMINHRESAEDVLQEALTSAFKNVQHFRYESSFGSWLKQIVINHCINHLNRRGLLTDELQDKHGTLPEAEEDYELVWTVEGIKKGMTTLSDGYRTVLNLYLLEGYDHTEIAEILGISESTSKTQYMRAKRKLKEHLINSVT